MSIFGKAKAVAEVVRAVSTSKQGFDRAQVPKSEPTASKRSKSTEEDVLYRFVRFCQECVKSPNSERKLQNVEGHTAEYIPSTKEVIIETRDIDRLSVLTAVLKAKSVPCVVRPGRRKVKYLIVKAHEGARPSRD